MSEFDQDPSNGRPPEAKPSQEAALQQEHAPPQEAAPGQWAAPPSMVSPPVGSPPPASKRPLPPDVLTPWGWGGLLIFLGVAIGTLVLLANGMAFGAMFWYHVKASNFENFAKTSATFNALLTGIWYVILMAYLFAAIRLGRHLPFWKTIGWRDFRASATPRAAKYLVGAVMGMGMAVVVELASMALHTKAKLPIEALFHSRIGVLWLMGVGILVAPAVEETIFRGFLYPVLARTLGVEGGILATGVLFGMMHAHQLWGGWGQIGLLVLVGIALTYARAKTGTVLASWLLHFGYNTFLFVGFFVSTGGLRHLPPVH
jgi:membrane protease YdiL (CAAX protease family)